MAGGNIGCSDPDACLRKNLNWFWSWWERVARLRLKWS